MDTTTPVQNPPWNRLHTKEIRIIPLTQGQPATIICPHAEIRPSPSWSQRIIVARKDDLLRAPIGPGCYGIWLPREWTYTNHKRERKSRCYKIGMSLNGLRKRLVYQWSGQGDRTGPESTISSLVRGCGYVIVRATESDNPREDENILCIRHRPAVGPYNKPHTFCPTGRCIWTIHSFTSV